MLKIKKYWLLVGMALIIGVGIFAILYNSTSDQNINAKVSASSPENENTSKPSSSAVKKGIQIDATYPSMSLENLSKEADTIIYAEVTNKLKPVVKYLEADMSIEADNRNEGKTIEYVQTPVELKVVSVSKGNYAVGDTVTYLEDGGETDDTIYNSSTTGLKVGDEVIIFLDSNGYAWGYQSIYQVNDGQVQVGSEDIANTNDIASKDTDKNISANSEQNGCTVEEFFDLIKSYQ